MSAASQPIRCGLLAASTAYEPWARQCLVELATRADVRPSVLVMPRAADALIGTGTRTIHTDEPAGDLPVLTLDSPGALARIAALELDFLLTWDDRDWPAELLTLPKLGVWRYQFGDWVELRGAAAGFWEVYTGRPVSVAMLARVLPDRSEVIALRSA
ncbi:MAG TPA: hypothetical protein VJQ47_11815, partial [Steroidobacteraceae bacterium]|nr:hypothetical protein [Steroidobacteraceae bacterium]